MNNIPYDGGGEFRCHVPAPEDAPLRDAVFLRMWREGLLGCAMSGYLAPDLQDWRRITDPARTWLVCCAPQDAPAASGAGAAEALLGAALFTPWRGRVWEFDFACFRAGMAQAVPLARAVLRWTYARAPIDAVVGLCPAPNRHVHGLFAAAGFAVLGRIPGACWWARRQKHVEGILVAHSRAGQW